MVSTVANPLFDLTGRRALITGSTQGIGFALATGLARAGATIVLNGRDSGRVRAAVEKLSAFGYTVESAVFDVTDQPAVVDGVDRVEKENGAIDILINNAGIQRRAPLDEFPSENWHALINANLNSVFYVSQAVAKHMIPRRRGKIINICSVQSQLGRPTIAPYTATKGAVAMLTKGMCADWAKYGIQANGLAPGYFETEMNKALVENEEFSAWLYKRTPAGRWGKVEELNGAAIFLASDASSFVNGQVIYVDGGMTSTV
ncbi:SDR family oxidoreductase [Propionivibrio soli]|uniref:SDR family oxidoreductase n=1 Tax=Propionivibrio soli TaxID=2976531 RepID=UPI0021E99F0F|nr:SDR family oxidoreductase [Propionivibrio soli]